MDYRHTEDFARRMEAAALRAQQLRSEAVADFGIATARLVRRGLRALWARIHPARRTHILPEA